MEILEIYTFNENGVGGVSLMVNAYMNATEYFCTHGCHLNLLNIKQERVTGKRSIDNFLYIFTQKSAVKQHLSENKYDAVHIHTSREFLFLKDVLLAKFIKMNFHIPVVITIHVGSIDTVYNRIGWFKKKSITLINKYIDKVIFLSEVMRQDYIKEGLKENVTSLLYNFFQFTPAENEKKEDIKTLQLLFVGAIHREKGIIELLKALNSLQDFDCHLNICGQLKDNSIRSEIEEYKLKLGNKVSFLGLVQGEEKTKIFDKSDILILPSYHEGLPIVIMEALGSGCGIMTTPVGAIPEILNDANCKWLEIGSYKSIESQLRSLTSKELMTMKEANKSLGKEYSLESHINKLSEIYKNL